MIYLPYTKLLPEVLEALDATGRPYTPCDVSSDQEAYWRLLRDIWAKGEEFTIVEHDIVVNEEVLDSFDACPEPYCAAHYEYMGKSRYYYGMGCVRFRAEVMTRCPYVIQEGVATFTSSVHPPKHWCTLDAALQINLMLKARFKPHHHGEVGHLGSTWPAHRCIIEGPTGHPMRNRDMIEESLKA